MSLVQKDEGAMDSAVETKNTGELVFRRTGLGKGQKTESRTSRQHLGDPGEEEDAMKNDMEAGPCPASLAPPLPLGAVWLRKLQA